MPALQNNVKEEAINKFLHYVKSVLFGAVVCLFPLSSFAQIGNNGAGADSIAHAILPVVSYSSDVGFIGGLIYDRYDYSGDMQPFKSYLHTLAGVSTKGFIKFNASYDVVQSFGTDIRSSANFDFFRLTDNNYFGMGNDTPFDKTKWNNDYYRFESVNVMLTYRGRKPFYSHGIERFDFTGGFGLEYNWPHTSRQQSSFNDYTPEGAKGGWATFLTAGFIWENRDSEFDPTKGNRAEFEIRYAPPLVSTFQFASFSLDLRKYLDIYGPLILALRLGGRHAAGEIPYWELSTLGDGLTLRGYPLNRFRGISSIYGNAELRSWLLKLPLYNVKIGAQLFTDVGRVFTGGDSASDLFGGYKQTIGIGGACSIFNPDFILRGDWGFSDEANRIYVGIGYLF